MKLPDLVTTVSERGGALRIATHSVDVDAPALRAPTIVVRHSISEAPAQALRRLSALEGVVIMDMRLPNANSRAGGRGKLQEVKVQVGRVRQMPVVMIEGKGSSGACDVVIYGSDAKLPVKLPRTFAKLRAKDNFEVLLKRVQTELQRALVDAEPVQPEHRGRPAADTEAAPAHRLRKHILETWPLLNALEVHQHVATSGSKPNPTTAHRLRDARKILGLKVGAAFHYPTFQFDPTTGQPRPEMAELLQLLPNDATGWRNAFWFAQPDRRLAATRAPVDFDSPDALERLDAASGARTPAEVFSQDPARVVAFARKEFHGA